MSIEDMNISERAAYLKGLAEGLQLDTSKPEGKLIDAMLDLIYDMSNEIEFLQEEENYDFLDDYDDDDYDFDEENPDYEVKCPDCGAEVVVDEDTLIEGEINCPVCGKTMEFDFTSLLNDEDENSEDELPF